MPARGVVPEHHESVSHARDDFEIPGPRGGPAEIALDERDRADLSRRTTEARGAVPRQRGIVVVAPEVPEPALGQGHDDLEVAARTEGTLDDRWICDGAREREAVRHDIRRTVPGRVRRCTVGPPRFAGLGARAFARERDERLPLDEGLVSGRQPRELASILPTMGSGTAATAALAALRTHGWRLQAMVDTLHFMCRH